MKKLTQEGFVLPFSMIMMALVILISGSYFAVTMNSFSSAKRTGDLTRAYYLADAGLADAFMQLRASANPPFGFTASNAAYPVTPQQTGSYSVDVTTDGTSWPTYILTSTGLYNGVSRTLELQARMSSFSKWNYLSNREVNPAWGTVWWITGMVMEGDIHTNGQFNLYGMPVFNGPASQVAPTLNYYYGTPDGVPPDDNPDFQQGITLNSPANSFPAAAEFTGLISTAAQQPQGLFLTGNSTIVLLNNGTMNVTNPTNGWVNQNVPVPTNGALYVNAGSATVQGTLQGQLTIGASNHIYVNGNVLYNTDPRTQPSSDLLGLVANNSVIVTSNAPYDVEIDAYIVALSGSFQVQNFWTFLKGDLVQFGGLTNSSRGPVGSFNSSTGQQVSGYSRSWDYDNRLEDGHMIPPWFPPLKDATGRITYSKISFAEF